MSDENEEDVRPLNPLTREELIEFRRRNLAARRERRNAAIIDPQIREEVVACLKRKITNIARIESIVPNVQRWVIRRIKAEFYGESK